MHTGVFNGYGGNVRYAEHEIAFVRGEIALFAGIDAQDADGFAVHHQRGGQDGNEPFGLGTLGVLEPAVAARIAQVDEFALEDFAVQPALGHFDGAFAHVTGREAPRRAGEQKLSRTVKQAKRACLAVHGFGSLFRDLVQHHGGFQAGIDHRRHFQQSTKIIMTCHCVSPLPPPAMPGMAATRYGITGRRAPQAFAERRSAV